MVKLIIKSLETSGMGQISCSRPFRLEQWATIHVYKLVIQFKTMNKFIIIIGSLLIMAACISQKTGKTVTISDENNNQEDSVTYELIILDPEFESWMITNSKPVWYHSQSYLESWNRMYVSAWNSKVTSGSRSRFFETYIDYQHHIDYGLELNYRLFYYFQFVERRLKIPILPAGLRPQSL